MKLAILLLAACGASRGESSSDAGGQTTDAPIDCLSLTFAPSPVYKGDHVKATAMANVGGVVGYSWLVNGVPNTSYEASDDSAIGFDVPDATSYTVSVSLTGPAQCTPVERTLNVLGNSGNVAMYRMRVIPPPDLAPPQETLIQINGGQTTQDRPFAIDPGTALNGSVVSGATPVSAYVKFTPVLGPAFDLVTTGTFTSRLALQMHSVLVIPQDNTLAPRVIAWAPGLGPTSFAVDPGTGYSGTVVDRSGAPLAGAQVQLEQLGVPSTIATTAANGSFSVRETFMAGQMTSVTVTPPATSGLARLTATAAFDLGSAMAISYVGSPATCDLNATPVKRGGVNQANAIVTIAGAIATAGTVTTGAVSTTATGTARIAATASAGGTLPTTLVPRASLSAIVQLGPTDFAVAAVDTTACAAQTIDAPAQIAASGVILDSTQQPIAGARVEAVPVGALAMANLIPIEATTSTTGAYSLALASGGHYELRMFDPGGRGAPVNFSDLVAAGVPATQALAPALAITGMVSVLNDANAIANASVQLLCSGCTGVAASQPIAQTATDITGEYRIAVADPGM
jgi:hypothetical protein